MGKREKRNGTMESAAEAVRAGGKSEKRLLRREREAELDLKSARARLTKAQHRLDRRLSAVADAEATLRGHQRARAVGPNGASLPGGEASVPLPATPAASSGNGTAPTIITGPDVTAALAEIETADPAVDAAPPATATRPARASRAKSGAKASAPETPPVALVVPSTEKPAPKRRRPSRAAKTSGDAS